MVENSYGCQLKPEDFKKVINALKFAYFAYYFSVGCIHNFYPVLLKKIKIPNTQIGILACIGLIGGTISPILIGYLADKTKKSRLILIIISLLTIISHAVPITTISTKLMLARRDPTQTLFSEKPNLSFIYTLYFFQFFVTFGDQATKALLDGVVHKVLGESAKVGIVNDFARLRMFGGIGIGLATAISGFCMDRVKKIIPEDIPEEFSLVVICVGMGTVLVIVLIRYVPCVETKEQVSFLGAIKNVVSRGDALVCFFAQFLIQFALNITKQFDVLYIQHLGGNKTWMGMATFAGYGADVLMMYLSPTISHAIGSKEATISLGSIVAVIRCLFYGYADSKYMAMNNSILSGFSLGLIIPTMSSLIKTKAPENLISSYVSLLVATGKIGAAIASYVGGVISEKYSYTMIFIISSVFFALSAILVVGYQKIFENNEKGDRSKKYTDKEEKMRIIDSEESPATE
ncbi:hypothetical protein HZS_4230 [Henneguya salminicola]|nr:hypothetical protein HZS_4230 [Henneguya salminicola]